MALKLKKPWKTTKEQPKPKQDSREVNLEKLLKAILADLNEYEEKLCKCCHNGILNEATGDLLKELMEDEFKKYF